MTHVAKDNAIVLGESPGGLLSEHSFNVLTLFGVAWHLPPSVLPTVFLHLPSRLLP